VTAALVLRILCLPCNNARLRALELTNETNQMLHNYEHFQ
jgi:hypothetical protein